MGLLNDAKLIKVRKIQENVIQKSVKSASEVVYGSEEPVNRETNPEWVNVTMCRLENKFENETVKKIRMNCQCGYTMDEKLALVKELMSTAGNMEAFINSEKAKTPVFSTELGNFY